MKNKDKISKLNVYASCSLSTLEIIIMIQDYFEINFPPLTLLALSEYFHKLNCSAAIIVPIFV